MDWLALVENIIKLKFTQDLSLTVIVVGFLGKQLIGIKKEIHDLKTVFTAQHRQLDKRLANTEGRVESIDYRIYAVEQTIKSRE